LTLIFELVIGFLGRDMVGNIVRIERKRKWALKKQKREKWRKRDRRAR